MKLNKGLIFTADYPFRKKGEALHPVIFWENSGGGYFLGLMITHSPKYGNLDLSSQEYYDWINDDFTTTYIVQALLLKPVDWLVDKTDIGQLSEVGIEYVENVIHQFTPITWDEYLNKF